VLTEILAELPAQFADPNLLIGNDTNDDAAVYRIASDRAIVASTDFFMPIVDDPKTFGRIAAANAVSDIYAVGATPIFALAVVGMPVNVLPPSIIGQVLAGGAQICAEAGFAVAGGHSIDAPEPIYGLAVVGLADPAKIKRNDTGEAGDVLILGKGLGTGILSAAYKKDQLDDAGYQQLVDTTTQLNKIGIDFAELDEVHAMTDITGFGILGHLLELCRGANVSAEITWSGLPILSKAETLAKEGFNTGAADRNWQSSKEFVTLSPNIDEWQRKLLADPQTGGGLLLSVSPDAVEQVLSMFQAQGFDDAQVIGRVHEGAPHVSVV
jgi:selenide, water dikinase